MRNEVRLKKTWFNPLFYHLAKYIEDPSIRKIMVYGGKSSAKTFSILQLFAIKTYSENCSVILYRKEQATIKTTLKNALLKAVESINFESAFETMDFRLACANGREMVMKGLDTEGKVKGIEGYKYLLFDELDHFAQEEWMQANLSLRGLANQKLFATWNPVNENSWIKKEIDAINWISQPLEIPGNPYSALSPTSSISISEDGQTVLIKNNYFDNKWMVGGDGYGFRDENLINQYELLSRVNTNWYRVNVLGEWGKPEVKNQWAHNFDYNKHVSDKAVFNPERRVYFSHDFNVAPMACIALHIWRDSEGDHIHFFKEISLNPGDAFKMAEKIEGSFTPESLYNAYFTGDASARARNTVSRDNIHNWGILQQKLKISHPRLQVPRANPRINDSKTLVNLVLALHPDIKFHPSMTTTINELQFTEADEEGGIIKANRENPDQKADFLDCVRYSVSSWLSDFRKLMRK